MNNAEIGWLGLKLMDNREDKSRYSVGYWIVVLSHFRILLVIFIWIYSGFTSISPTLDNSNIGFNLVIITTNHIYIGAVHIMSGLIGGSIGFGLPQSLNIGFDSYCCNLIKDCRIVASWFPNCSIIDLILDWLILDCRIIAALSSILGSVDLWIVIEDPANKDNIDLNNEWIMMW